MAESQARTDGLPAELLIGSMSRRAVLLQSVALGLTAPVVAGLLAACGGDDDDDANG